MSNRAKTLQYESDSSVYEEEDTDEEEKQPATCESNQPVEPNSKNQAIKSAKIPGVRARDLKPKTRNQSFQCQYCGRPFCVQSYHQKHEEKCPVRLKRDAEWARELAKTKSDVVAKTKRKQEYQAKKAILEASRPVVVEHKKRGRKPNPKTVVIQEPSDSESEVESEYSVSDSDSEPEIQIVRRQKPKERPPTISKPKPAPVRAFAPVRAPEQQPAYIIRF